jgi:hypothetical protein
MTMSSEALQRFKRSLVRAVHDSPLIRPQPCPSETGGSQALWGMRDVHIGASSAVSSGTAADMHLSCMRAMRSLLSRVITISLKLHSVRGVHDSRS